MNGYVEGGYLLTLGTLAAYALWVARRRRALSRILPPPPERDPR